MEVTDEDLVVGYVSQTAQRMKEVCEAALGGVLFIDEAYRLVPEHDGHSFGKDAPGRFYRPRRARFGLTPTGSGPADRTHRHPAIVDPDPIRRSLGVGATGTGTAGRVTMSPVCLSVPTDYTRGGSESN
jgi:hypothetical protein